MADQTDQTVTSENSAPNPDNHQKAVPATAPEVPAELAESVTDADAADEAMGDPKTDAAVDDIMKHDGDEALQAQDEASEAGSPTVGRWARCKQAWNQWWASPRKRYTTIGVIIVLLAAVFAVPVTRYNVLGLILKSSATVQVVDSKTGAPVSGATVNLAGQKAETDAEGRATMRVHAGSKTLTVAKHYYKSYSHSELVALTGGKNHFKATLGALGRQVKVKVVNQVSGQPLAGATVKAGSAHATTDKSGLTTVVIPSGAVKQVANISLHGFNAAKVTLTAADDLAKNTFKVVPAGKLYFLSNLSGKIDVVKTNLDGSDRQVVLAGTGNEDRNSTSLLASRDWKYLALLAKRSGSNASVYLIDTTKGDKLTTIDEGNANFSLVGWSGDRFVYTVVRNGVSAWQPNQQALKSFDPATGQALLLDQTQGSGTGSSNFAGQSFGTPYLMDDQVVYSKNWSSSYYDAQTELAGKSAELDSIGANGSGHRTIKTFTAATPSASLNVQATLYEPDGLYMQFYDGSKNAYYDYDDGKVSVDTDMTDTKFYNTPYPTYLLSPAGSNTFWADQRDGKNTLFTGDEDAKAPKQIASLSEYNAYGWYGNDYLLVSKNSSELYIMSKDGGTPLKIADYYKPAINYQGYGGGYGGL